MPNSLAIALAWPETFCKKAGAWYDQPAELLGISKNNFYKVGHSAIVLVNPKNGHCCYFDFGRYHAPLGYGRVRDEVTDHELKINTTALLNKDLDLMNYKDIIDEVQQNPSCHGDGQLYAGLSLINFQNAYGKAKKMQNQGAINYGPFTHKGTNCSRFVNSILINSCLSPILKLKLISPKTLSPTPIGIVKNLKYQRKANLHQPTVEAQKSIEKWEILTY